MRGRDESVCYLSDPPSRAGGHIDSATRESQGSDPSAATVMEKTENDFAQCVAKVEWSPVEEVS